MKCGSNGLSFSSLFCGPWGWALKAKDGGIKNRTAWGIKVIMLPPYQPWATYIWLCLERKWTSFLSKLLLFQMSLLATNYYSSFLNYESMITHLQETWKSQNKGTFLTAILNWYTSHTTNMKLPCFLPLQVSIVILAVGGGPVLVREWWTPGGLIPVTSPQNCYFSVCPSNEPQLTPPP